MNTTSSCCGGTSTSPCTSSIAELPRYYPRQLITPADLTLEQDYFRDRLRRHNRLLHGWGVVCGALVCPVSVTNPDGSVSFSPWVVQVQPGYILGPYGDEILLDCPRTVDVRTQGVSGVTGEPCIDAPDPWCTQVFTPPVTTTPTDYYVAVKYVQSMTRPVRVQPMGCGCDDSSCEYSRWHDGYQIGVLDQCPPCNQPAVIHRTAGSTTDPAQGGNGPAIVTTTTAQNPDCPDCSCGPWVGLAKVTVDPSGTILAIDNCACRRIVTSFAQVSHPCLGPLPTISSLIFGAVQSGATNISMTVVGTGFLCGAKAAFDTPDLVVTQTQVQDSKNLILTVSVSAAVGTVLQPNLVVTNLDGSASAKFPTSITVAAKTTPARASAVPPSPTGSRTKASGKKPSAT